MSIGNGILKELDRQFHFNAYGLNPYDIVIKYHEDLSPQIMSEMLLESDVDFIGEIGIKEINDWLAKRKEEWILEHGVPI